MNDTINDPAPDGASDDRHRRVVIAVVGCAVLAVLAVTLLLLVGVRHVPELPTVRERPDPPVAGRLAVQLWDDQDGLCIDVEELDTGDRRHVYCEGMPLGPAAQPMGVNWFGWNEAGQLQLASYKDDEIQLLTFDVGTGEVVDEEMLPADTRPPDTRRRADGSTLTIRSDPDGHASVWINGPEGDRRVVYEVRGPDGYTFWSAQWSPDGDYALIRDSAARWIVLRAEGDPVPRILTRDADQVAWYQG